jgi:hypothetical protein
MHARSIMDEQPPKGRDPRRQRSTESYGLGQSGYTAGRHEEDPALELEIEVRNRSYHGGISEHILELGTDDRWCGRGGSGWSPDEPNIDEPGKPSSVR